MKRLIQKAKKNQLGATMVEYALMLALIAIVCIAAVTLIGTEADSTFSDAAACLGATGGTGTCPS